MTIPNLSAYGKSMPTIVRAILAAAAKQVPAGTPQPSKEQQS